MSDIIRTDAIYARQSVDKKDSISIESQIEFCRHELKGGEAKEYQDKGFSGKNTDRPQFQQLVKDIEAGLIARVVVYKLDRISRSILDFAKMMSLFEDHNVEFVSSTEKFDTSTPMGRAMLNICIVFAQLERETIQNRITDAYYSRSRSGLKTGGVTPFGYRTEPVVMHGVRTKKLISHPEEADIVKLLFEMYAQPDVSYGDLTRYLREWDINLNGKEWTRSTLGYLLRNPVYTQADIEIYEYFKNHGADIVNDMTDFTGLNGCYLIQGRDVKNHKAFDLHNQLLVLAPHEGIVPSDVWLACRKKLDSNISFNPPQKAKHTWLAGKIKCGRCGFALLHMRNKEGRQYLRCSKRLDNMGCEGCGTIRLNEIEQAIHVLMSDKLSRLSELADERSKPNPKTAALKAELCLVDEEIERLIDSLSQASPLLISYANSKIADLDGRRQSLIKKIAEVTANIVSAEQKKSLSAYLNDWDSTDFNDKRRVADMLISRINATSDSLEIEWKI